MYTEIYHLYKIKVFLFSTFQSIYGLQRYVTCCQFESLQPLRIYKANVHYYAEIPRKKLFLHLSTLRLLSIYNLAVRI